EEGREPTEHILNEILEQVDAFEKYGKEIFLIVKNEDALRNPKINEVLRKIPDITVRFGDFGENLNRLGRRMHVDPENLPLIAVFKGSLKGIYAASGYNVGTGALLLQVLEWLAEET
ncbi:MAG: transglutaminase, partial [Lachnospiraceae bacterium]|nr:transglutaminase [Lachnospiraceae bacterium]